MSVSNITNMDYVAYIKPSGKLLNILEVTHLCECSVSNVLYVICMYNNCISNI